MEYIYIFAGFMFGSILGSFSGVLLERIPREENYVSKPSYCLNCKKPLRFYHNIPIFSWLFLRGKCGYCESKIPLRLFLIELLSGIFFALAVFFTGANLIFMSLIIMTYLVIMFIGGIVAIS